MKSEDLNIEVKEQFTDEDIAELDELEDFESKHKVTYEIWLVGNDKEEIALDFSILIDDGYDTLTEAEKCFNYFENIEMIKEFFEIKKISIPEEIKYLYLRLEAVELDEDGEFVCTELYDEKEFIL